MNIDLFIKAGIQMPSGPDFKAEQTMIQQHGAHVCGVDEVGRGPLAGPVVAAAVILDPEHIPVGLNDSKKLSANKRGILAKHIMESAVAVAIAGASVDEIDTMNILQASLLAMRRSVVGLGVKATSALVDGNCDPGLGIPTKTLVKGDARSLSIAASSIIAKNFRDNLMKKLAKIYPEYGWEKNAGYGVPHHRQALKLVGVSPHHRKTFAPIRDILD